MQPLPVGTTPSCASPVPRAGGLGSGLGRLRATDVDSLRDRVRDTALRTALGSIERVWRGVSEDGRRPSAD
ncbi:hypothetical protein RB199_30440 [Streptomyces libani]|uniref:hypothetical protein n=1 Tax=Streptomyces nigrescens TaxID=1920 RepID=UPI0030347E95